jgi:hypothetical protein
LAAGVRAFLPAFLPIKCAHPFTYRLICLADVHDRFVRKPSSAFGFKVKLKARRRDGGEW